MYETRYSLSGRGLACFYTQEGYFYVVRGKHDFTRIFIWELTGFTEVYMDGKVTRWQEWLAAKLCCVNLALTNLPRTPFPVLIDHQYHRPQETFVWDLVTEVKHQPLKSEGCTYNCQNVAGNKVPFLSWTDKETVVHPSSGIVPINKKRIKNLSSHDK